MYSEKLEEVISAALADGNLTDQKRNIIMRRAEKEGEDVEEVMMVVESRLLNQTKKQSNQSQSKKWCILQNDKSARRKVYYV